MLKQKKRILLTNGRSPMTLCLARLLASAGDEIFVTDPTRLHYCVFSNCVKKNFQVPPPKYRQKEYIQSLCEIAAQEKIDLLIPTWEDVLLVAKYRHLFPVHCQLFVSDFDLLGKIHNKWSFIQFLSDIGIEAPRTQIVRSLEELKRVDIPQFALKPSYSRSSKHVFKVEKGGPLPPVSPSHEEEWIAQEWLDGKIFCTYTLCHKGKIHAHSIYPMEFIKKQQAKGHGNVGSYCLSFRSIEHRGIYQWVEEFARKTNFTGQLAFDMVELPSGQIYAFECNPRLTSGICLFQPSDQIDQAFFGLNQRPILASTETLKQIFLAMLFFGWKPAVICKRVGLYLKRLWRARDVVFHPHDVKPFLSQPFLFVKYLLLSFKKKSSIPVSFTDDLDYNGESA